MKKRFAITGASGLLGANLAIALLQQGHTVIATRRGKSRIDHLSAYPIQWIDAALDQPDALQSAFSGCDGVFHCAAAVSVQFKIEPWIYAANVEGTRNVLQAAQAAEVPRLIHCSTTSALGLSTDGLPSDETVPFNFAAYGLDDAYVQTKRQAQDLVLQAASDGMNALIVNPAFMIGPYDAKPSSGSLVRSLLLGKVPAYTLGTNNFVDVRDVARGMLQAYERGKAGEMYILSGENMTYKDFMDRVSQVTGCPKVRFRVPAWTARIAGWCGDQWSTLTSRETELNSATIRWSLNDRYLFRCDKAIRDLHYTISPLDSAIADCAAWFREHRML